MAGGALVRVEAGNIGAVQVDLRGPIGHPLGNRAGDSRRFLDPERGHRPDALDLRLTEQGHPVGSQRD
jgi:hypothetical protein